MPLFMYVDDIIYDGDETVFRKLALYASVCAILVLNVNAELTRNPQIFYPTNADATTLADFAREYRIAFDILLPFFENSA